MNMGISTVTVINGNAGNLQFMGFLTVEDMQF